MKQQTIYLPGPLEGSELCHPLDENDFEKINLLVNGKFRLDSWKPIRMQLIHEDRGTTFDESDCPWLGEHALIFRRKVIDTMGPLLRQHGELLPLSCDEAELWMYNPTHVIDALDESASDIRRANDGRILRIRKYVFRLGVVGDIDIFKLPTQRTSITFVGQRFVDEWNASGLKGLQFDPNCEMRLLPKKKPA